MAKKKVIKKKKVLIEKRLYGYRNKRVTAYSDATKATIYIDGKPVYDYQFDPSEKVSSKKNWIESEIKTIVKPKVSKKKIKKVVVPTKRLPEPLVEQTAPYRVVLRDSKGKFVSSKTPSKAKIVIFYDKLSKKQLGSKYDFPKGLSAKEKRTFIEAIEEQVTPKKPRKVYVPPARKLQKTFSTLKLKEHTKSKEVYSPQLKDFLQLKRKHLRLAQTRPVDHALTERDLLKETFRKHAEKFLKKTSDSKKLYILTLITKKKDGTESGFSFPRSQVRNIKDFMDDFDRMMNEFEKKNKEYFKKGAFHQFNDGIKGLIIEATY